MRGTLHSTFKSFNEARDYAKRMFLVNRQKLATWVEEVPRGYGVFFLRTNLNPPQRFPTKKAGAFRMEKSHAFIGKGLVYCPVYHESAAPVLTHSRVKCGLCKETIQSITNPAISAGKSPLAHQLKAEMMEGKTPASALKAVARRFAGRVPRAAIMGAFKAVKDELVGGFDGDRSIMADWAGISGMRMQGYRKFSKNLSKNPRRKSSGKGPVERPRLIYGRATSLSFGPDGKVTQMTARKTSGPYKKKDFVHDFKPGVKHIGLPRGTAVTTPDGQTFKMKTRTALMVGPKNLWADFRA